MMDCSLWMWRCGWVWLSYRMQLDVDQVAFKSIIIKIRLLFKIHVTILFGQLKIVMAASGREKWHKVNGKQKKHARKTIREKSIQWNCHRTRIHDQGPEAGKWRLQRRKRAMSHISLVMELFKMYLRIVHHYSEYNDIELLIYGTNIKWHAIVQHGLLTL